MEAAAREVVGNGAGAEEREDGLELLCEGLDEVRELVDGSRRSDERVAIEGADPLPTSPSRAQVAICDRARVRGEAASSGGPCPRTDAGRGLPKREEHMMSERKRCEISVLDV